MVVQILLDVLFVGLGAFYLFAPERWLTSRAGRGPSRRVRTIVGVLAVLVGASQLLGALV